MTPFEMKGLWTLAGQTWGQKFMEQYGTEPNQAWSSALSQIGLPAAKAALRKLINTGSGFAPTLPEFVSAAKEFHEERPMIASNTPLRDLLPQVSEVVRQFNVYGDYERWRVENTRQGKKPPHPKPGTADWLYLHHLAVKEAVESNKRLHG